MQNFENLNPSNSYWTKYYNLYVTKIDSETERFLDFETWWTGYFLLNARARWMPSSRSFSSETSWRAG